mmetsp:Transcript_51891/g.85914  ORF Transcript_51891/g.85914 Transcript_51891/m.85914 type:complete len:148 (+) Transcript_51891:113-556(+)
MAEANTKDKRLYLEENVKRIKQLPHDIVRVCSSYDVLNQKCEQDFENAHQLFTTFQNQTQSAMTIDDDNNNDLEWTSMDSECLANLQKMRECEENMMMFQEEKIELLHQHIGSLDTLIGKMAKDLRDFQKKLQPNMIKLPFPNSKKM